MKKCSLWHMICRSFDQMEEEMECLCRQIRKRKRCRDKNDLCDRGCFQKEDCTPCCDQDCNCTH